MFKFTQILLLRINRNNHSHIRFNNFSTITTAELKNVPADSSDANNKTFDSKTHRPRNSIVAAAFASLQTATTSNDIKTPFTDSKILSATTVDDLLSISEGNGISRNHAVKVVSILADWSLKGKVNLPDFETDPRFIRLCKVLTRGSFIMKNNRNNPWNRNEDLSTILSVTADDEAAKLITGITLPQMVKVMTTLSQKKRRSTTLLRALSYNITKRPEVLNLKQCSDLLYSTAVLNFPDENLLERVSSDIIKGLNDDLQKSSIIGSILTSLGLLKYKEPGVLDALSEWMVKHNDLCRPQDMFALFLTLAVLNYEPSNAENLYKVLLPQLTVSDTSKLSEWLDTVWSLVLLNRAHPDQVADVLSKEFIEKMEKGNLLSLWSKVKLLNIDAAAEYLISGYAGTRLESLSNVRNIEIVRSKEKEEMSAAIVDTLKNLMSTPNLKSKVNTGMGFYIDAECMLDKKCNPVSPDKYSSSDHIRIAVVSYDYHDMCIGRIEPTGVNVLITRLLEAKGYKVLSIPYTEFKPKDKLVHRVQCLEMKLKRLVQS